MPPAISTREIPPLPVNILSVIGKQRNFGGSLIGGIAEKQEMLGFCGRHDITSDIKIIPMQDSESAYARMLKAGAAS